MINSNLVTISTLLLLGLVAAFGYYRGVIALASRNILLNSSRWDIAVGLLYLLAAMAASGVAILFYFSL